MVNVTTG